MVGMKFNEQITNQCRYPACYPLLDLFYPTLPPHTQALMGATAHSHIDRIDQRLCQ